MEDNLNRLIMESHKKHRSVFIMCYVNPTGMIIELKEEEMLVKNRQSLSYIIRNQRKGEEGTRLDINLTPTKQQLGYKVAHASY